MNKMLEGGLTYELLRAAGVRLAQYRAKRGETITESEAERVIMNEVCWLKPLEGRLEAMRVFMAHERNLAMAGRRTLEPRTWENI